MFTQLNVKISDNDWRLKDFAYAKQLGEGVSNTLSFKIGLIVSNFFRSIVGLSSYVVLNARAGDELHKPRGLEKQYLLLKSEVDAITRTATNTFYGSIEPPAARAASPALSVGTPQTTGPGLKEFKDKLTRAKELISEKFDPTVIDRLFSVNRSSFLEDCKSIAKTDPSVGLFNSLITNLEKKPHKSTEDKERLALLKDIKKVWDAIKPPEEPAK